MNIIFSNLGEIDVRLITTLGINVKQSNSPIGYFGTGLKYGIAVCLREGCEVEILSGLDKHKFYVEQDTIRGKAFGFIMMQTIRQGIHAESPHRLGFTTELGKNWKLWMAYREFYCNAKDEGGDVSLGEKPLASSDQTHVIVTGAAFLREHHQRSAWLLSGTPLLVMPGLEVYNHPARTIFYKGIKVSELPREALYTYNILSEERLSEDRTLDSWTASYTIRNQLSSECINKAFLRKILSLQNHDLFEANLDWNSVFACSISETFSSVVEDLWNTHNAFLPSSAIEACRSRFKQQELKSVYLTPVQEMMLSRAKNFLSQWGYHITAPIIVVESLGSQWVAGIAKDNKIIIPLATFGKGTKFLVSTLLEEHLHVTQNLRDCSRELQDWLFDRVISLYEEAHGEPI